MAKYEIKSNIIIFWMISITLAIQTPAHGQPDLNAATVQPLLDVALTLLDLGQAKFAPLTKAEAKLFEAAARGEIADCSGQSEKDNDPANAANWPKARSIRAECIGWLCTDPEASALVNYKGIQVKGARIDGEIDLEFAKIPFPLFFEQCAFGQFINLKNAEIEALFLPGTHTGPILADSLKVESDVFLRDGFKSEGEVRLLGATIGGQLSCIAGQFINPNGYALNADKLKVGGDVFLRNGFKSEGEVRLHRATIGGQLSCIAGQFINPSRYALSGRGLTVKGNVFMRDGFRAEGKVDLSEAYLSGADIRGADLRDADLRVAYLRGADLRGADLRGTDLRGADLRGADLRGAELSGADLDDAYLSGADLSDASIWSATLRNANLTNANLTNANLMNAKLEGVTLASANLKGADFSFTNLSNALLQKADLSGTNFHGADLSLVSGLHTIKATSPAIYNNETLFPYGFKPDKKKWNDLTPFLQKYGIQIVATIIGALVIGTISFLIEKVKKARKAYNNAVNKALKEIDTRKEESKTKETLLEVVRSILEVACNQEELTMLKAGRRSDALFRWGVIFMALSVLAPFGAAFMYVKLPAQQQTISKQMVESLVPNESKRDWRILFSGVSFGFLYLAAGGSFLRQEAKHRKTHARIERQITYYRNMINAFELTDRLGEFKKARKATPAHNKMIERINDVLLSPPIPDEMKEPSQKSDDASRQTKTLLENLTNEIKTVLKTV